MPVICVMEPKSTSPIANKKSYMAYIPAVLLTVGIAVISLWEAPHLPPPVMSLGDKVLHGLMYTVLAAAWMAAVVPQFMMYDFKFKILSATGVCLAVTAYGALLEVLQRFCTLTRSGEMADVYADYLGAALGVGIVVLYCYIRYTVIPRYRKNEK